MSVTRIPFHATGERRVIKNATTQREMKPRLGWLDQCLPCVGADPTLFDVDDDEIDSEKIRSVTAAYCMRCPARLDCVLDGMQTGDESVMRGGLALPLDRYHRRTCIDCGLPAAMVRDGDLCDYCALVRENKGDEL